MTKVKILLWFKKYWGVVLAVLVGAKFFFRGNPATPIDKDSWREREELREREDNAKKEAVDTLVNHLDDDFDERRERILSKARGSNKE